MKKLFIAAAAIAMLAAPAHAYEEGSPEDAAEHYAYIYASQGICGFRVAHNVLVPLIVRAKQGLTEAQAGKIIRNATIRLQLHYQAASPERRKGFCAVMKRNLVGLVT